MSYLKTRILIVEDNLQDFIIFKEVLSQIRDFFIQIEHAEDLQSAIEKATESEFDIVFLDLFLPDSFGQESFIALRQVIKAPIVILSGLSDESIALDIVKQGAQDYIVKGEFDANLLEKTVVYSIERKKYQEILEESEHRYRTIIESVSIAIAEYDYSELHDYLESLRSDGVVDILDYLKLDMAKVKALRKKIRITNINPVGLQLHACASMSEFEKYSTSFYLPEAIRYYEGFISAIWNNQETFSFELPFLNRANELIYTLKRWKFLGNQAGFYRMLISTEDVTALKNKEAELAHNGEVMQAVAGAASILLNEGDLEEKIELAIEKVGLATLADKMAVFLLHPQEDGSIQYTRSGYWDVDSREYKGSLDANINDLDVSETLSTLLEGKIFVLEHKKTSKSVSGLLAKHGLQKAVLSPMTITGNVGGLLVYGLDKSRNIPEYILNALLTLSGNLGSAIANAFAKEQLKDINEDLEKHVHDRTTKLRQAISELESFSYSVSHDLRAPLRAVSGFTEVLYEEYSDNLDETAQHYLTRIRAGAHEMSELIDDLLDFSRMGRKQLVATEVGMEQLTNEVVAELKSQVPDRQIQFNMNVSHNCQGDASMIRQVLVNLIWNAIKFTGKNGEAQISIGSADHGEFISYCIEDNGVGFDMAYADKLFGVFQRLHPHEDFEGTGVGLAIVQRIVSRHGGKVTPHGEEGKGARFEFTLPKHISSVPVISDLAAYSA
ncbi:MAG: ATP-binding protein [Flavobacteriales bacterium]|nr:ATP-binding protein [Flavobacteriales bacterium]